MNDRESRHAQRQKIVSKGRAKQPTKPLADPAILEEFGFEWPMDFTPLAMELLQLNETILCGTSGIWNRESWQAEMPPGEFLEEFAYRGLERIKIIQDLLASRSDSLAVDIRECMVSVSMQLVILENHLASRTQRKYDGRITDATHLTAGFDELHAAFHDRLEKLAHRDVAYSQQPAGPSKPVEKTFSVDEAATELGVTERHIRRQIAGGKLKAIPGGIAASEIERYRRENSTPANRRTPKAGKVDSGKRAGKMKRRFNF